MQQMKHYMWTIHAINLLTTVRVENFVQDFALFRKFQVLIPPSTCIIFVSSATHEKCEIKNTSKFSTRMVYGHLSVMAKTLLPVI